jgi:Ricin-type beta-trefoil lectin domain
MADERTSRSRVRMGGGTTIYAMGGTRCIDVLARGTAAGTPIDSATCNGTPAQVWVYNKGAFVNPNSELCLDATTMQNHVVLVINPCDDSPGQTQRRSLRSRPG